jgi:hypothetical protein
MTQADNAPALRMSLDSHPTPGQGQALVTAVTPLPPGWGSFCSRPDKDNPPHWYAVSPYAVDAIKDTWGRDAYGLDHTVHAPTWQRLHAAVEAQVKLYDALTTGGAP